MKELTDYDLDVMNALSDFPIDSENAFVYIRAGKEGGFVETKGEDFRIMQSIYSVILSNDQIRDEVFNAVLNYMKLNADIDDMFFEHIEDIKRDKGTGAAI